MSTPYAFINDQFQGYGTLRDRFSNNPQERAKFDQLNRHIRNQPVLPGQIVIVGEGPPHMCTPDENQLMYLAGDIHASMIPMEYTSSNVMTHNFDLLQSVMSYGSIGIGSSTGEWSKHLKGVESTLKEIEALYKRWRAGALTNDQFFAQRSFLFSKLDMQLKGVARFGSGLKNNGNIKKMLGISSKSYLHTGEIQDYARKVQKVSTVAKKLSKGTYAGIALDVGVGALEIQEACSIGREADCTKAKYLESGKTAGGLALAWGSGIVGTATGSSICIALGIPSGGTSILVCSIISGALAGWGGGKMGSALGEKIGTTLYEGF